MTSLAAQIIDQQVSGLVERHAETFAGELRAGGDEHRKRAIAFLFLVARTAFDLTDQGALDGIVDGGDDFGIRRAVLRAARRRRAARHRGGASDRQGFCSRWICWG